MGIFNDALTDLVVGAERLHKQRCSILWRFCPSDPEAIRWSCWIDGRPEAGVWRGPSGIAAMQEALRALVGTAAKAATSERFDVGAPPPPESRHEPQERERT